MRPGIEVERRISICRRNETGLAGIKTLEAECQEAGNFFNVLTT